MSSFYYVPTADKTLTSVKSTVLAAGVSLLFVYIVNPHWLKIHYSFQFIVTFVLEREEKDRNRIKQKLL